MPCNELEIKFNFNVDNMRDSSEALQMKTDDRFHFVVADLDEKVHMGRITIEEALQMAYYAGYAQRDEMAKQVLALCEDAIWQTEMFSKCGEGAEHD